MTRAPAPGAVTAVIAAAGLAMAAACRDREPRRDAGTSSPGDARVLVSPIAPTPAEPPSAPPAASGGSGDGSQTEVQHGPPRVIVMPEPVVVLPHQEAFRLEDPGQAPRAPLRYQRATAAAAVIARSQLTSRHLERGDFTPQVRLPDIIDGFAISRIAGAPARVTLRALPASAAAASADADAYLAPWRTLLEGHSASVEIDDRGGLGAVQLDDDPKRPPGDRARDELTQRLLSLIVPVPAEPVGRGARWRAVTVLRHGSSVVKQTATYSLLAVDRGRWKLHVKLLRAAQQQAIMDPALPRGTSAELVALFRLLEGDVEVDPAVPLASGGTLKLESRLHARLQPPGQGSAGIIESMFEDTGTVVLIRCRAAAPAASPSGDCPAGFVPANR